jgi:hypothetical protein
MDATSAPDSPAVPDAGISTFAESWTGYIENFMFSSGSDAVRISFTVDSAGQVSGVVTLGDGTPPPPPTDPNVGYPADLLTKSNVALLGGPDYIAEGFAYPMTGGTLAGSRLRFTIATVELWRDWCALQTPVGTSGRCLPNTGAMISADQMRCALLDPATNQYVPVDCGKFALCSQSFICLCDASTCSLNDDGRSRTSFDLNLSSGTAASGSLSGQLGQHNVHFTRNP